MRFVFGSYRCKCGICYVDRRDISARLVGYKARGLMEWIGSAGAGLSALEARMRVHAVNMRKYN